MRVPNGRHQINIPHTGLVILLRSVLHNARNVNIYQNSRLL